MKWYGCEHDRKAICNMLVKIESSGSEFLLLFSFLVFFVVYQELEGVLGDGPVVFSILLESVEGV